MHVVQHLALGGIEALALELARHAPKGLDAHIVSLEGTLEEARRSWPRLASTSVRLHFMNKPPGWSPATVRRLSALFRATGVAAVHTHHIGPLIYGGCAARLARVPVLTHTEHDAWHLSARRRRVLQRLALRVVRPTLLADAGIVAAAHARWMGSRCPRVIPNGVDLRRFSPGDRLSARARLGLPGDARVVGCAGRLERVKGHDVMLEALARAKPSIHFVLAGVGSCDQHLRAQAARLGLGRRVHFLGHVEDMPTFYRALDLFCLPSRNEGLPLALLEAQACGVAAASSDVGGCSEALCPSTGRLVPPEDVEAWRQALERPPGKSQTRSPRDFVTGAGDIRDTARAYADLVGGGV